MGFFFNYRSNEVLSVREIEMPLATCHTFAYQYIQTMRYPQPAAEIQDNARPVREYIPELSNRLFYVFFLCVLLFMGFYNFIMLENLLVCRNDMVKCQVVLLSLLLTDIA